MNFQEFISEINSILTEKYDYLRYYFSNMLTMLKYLNDKVSVRKYETTVISIKNINTIMNDLNQNKALYSNKTIHHNKLKNQIKTIQKCLREIIEDIKSSNMKPTRRLESDPIFSEYQKLLFVDNEVYNEIDKLAEQTLKFEKKYQQNNVILHLKIKNEIANIFWIKELKTQYIVHVKEVYRKLLKFLQTNSIYTFFISQFNQKNITQRLDKNQQYFISASNITDLFKDFIDPKIINKFFEQTTLTKSLYTIDCKKLSKNLKLKYNSKCEIQTFPKFANNSVLVINADVVQFPDNHKIKTQYPYVAMFGRKQGIDVRLNNKNISRNQFIIVSQNYEIEQYSVVCTSPTNVTSIVYPQMTQIFLGMMIKVGNHIFNFTNIEDKEEQEKINNNEVNTITNEKTVDNSKTKIPNYFKTKIKFTCLSVMIEHGKNKGMKKILKSSENQKIFKIGPKNNDDLQSDSTSQIFFQNKKFFIDRNTEIIIKTAEQFKNKRPSSKIPLRTGYKIYSDCFQFTVM